MSRTNADKDVDGRSADPASSSQDKNGKILASRDGRATDDVGPDALNVYAKHAAETNRNLRTEIDPLDASS